MVPVDSFVSVIRSRNNVIVCGVRMNSNELTKEDLVEVWHEDVFHDRCRKKT